MAYDTTLDDTLTTSPSAAPRPAAAEHDLPACLTRNRLDSPYFPALSRGGLAVVAVLCAAFLLTSFNRINHTDSWGHLNFGRWIVAHGQLPASDPFAAEAGLAPRFLNAPWLAQVAAYLVHRAAGEEGLIALHALLALAACGLTLVAVRLRGVGWGWAAAAAAAVYILSLPVMGTLRPQLAGVVGLPLVMIACTQLPARRTPLLWLPLVFAVWANLHGSFVIGLAALGVYAAGQIGELAWRERNLARLVRHRDVVRLTLAVVLSFAAVCVNPLGWRLIPAVVSFGSHAALDHISEWRPLVLGSLSGGLVFASLVLTAVLLRASPRRIAWHEAVLLLFFAVVTLSTLRMLAWWAIVWPWVVAPHAAAVARRWADAIPWPAAGPAPPQPMHTVLAMGLVFTTLLVAPPTHALVSGHARGIARTTSTDTPIYLAAELVRRQAEGRFAAPMDWSDYVVWSTDGRLRPLVYTHVHLLSDEAWRDNQQLARGEADWLDIARRQRLDYVVASRARQPQLVRAISQADRRGPSGVILVYQDAHCVLAKIKPATEPLAATP